MKAPRPSFTPSRHNVGAYEVRVRVARWKEEPKGLPLELLEFPSHPGLQFVKLSSLSSVIEQGKVSAEGSLTLEPERWAVRHYRRAVMRGAGVYQAGLWAFLAGQRVKHQSGAALVGNDAGTLARFGSSLKPPPQHLTQVIDMPPQAGEMTVRQREAAQIGELERQILKGTNEAIKASARYIEKIINGREAVTAELKERLSKATKDAIKLLSVAERSASLAALFSSIKSSFTEQRLSLGSDAERVIFDEVQRQLLRYLRRLLLPRPERPQRPASVPRPLHARPRPPAAPLAPPPL